MKNHQIVERDLITFLRGRSGLEAKRDYLGISSVVKCPRQAYNDVTVGYDTSDFSHQLAYAGYLFEADVLERLKLMGLASGKRAEVVAPFDNRLRGHTDGMTPWGDLLEIKSLNAQKFRDVVENGRAPFPHFAQVQLYMRYGPWKKAWIVYVSRDTMEHKVFEVPYNLHQATLLEARARLILDALDHKQAPECTCGRCRKLS